MEWIKNIKMDARVAYLLTLTEKLMDKLKNEDGYKQARKSLDMCWEWVEERKYSGDELYIMLDNEEDTGVSVYIELTEDAQKEAIWSCVIDAISYTVWQAYNYENEKYLPAPIELVNESTLDHFNEEIIKIKGFNDGWEGNLKKYIIVNYSSNDNHKKINKIELINQL